MNALRMLLAGLLATAGSSVAAQAASSEWFEAQGARIRIVTSDKADASGRLRGALDIELEPGWKTYWRDPGDAGVPPSVDVSKSTNLRGAELDFPVPERHDDGDYIWAGYSKPVLLPIVFTLADPSDGASIKADVFLGVCQEICVPVQTVFSIDTAEPSTDGDDEAAVASAFAGLAPAASAGFAILPPTIEGDRAIFEAVLPKNAKPADFFLAAAEGYAFATPMLEEKDGRWFFTVKAMRPQTPPGEGALHYTLVTDQGAVSGTLPYF